MSEYVSVLIDTGLMVAFYDASDRHHKSVVQFFAGCTAQLITTVGCVTEVMWLLAPNWRVQNTFLTHLAQGIYYCESFIAC
jgi:uncharacterized protein